MGCAWLKNNYRVVTHDNMGQHSRANKEVTCGLAWVNVGDAQIITLPVKCLSKLKTSWGHRWIGESVSITESIEGENVVVQHKQCIAIYTVCIEAQVQRIRVSINIGFDDSTSEHSDSDDDGDGIDV